MAMSDDELDEVLRTNFGKPRTPQFFPSEVERLRRQLGELEEERDRWRKGAKEWERLAKLAKAAAENWEHAARQWERQVGLGSASIDPAILRKLLRLCHPDRWVGTELEPLANEVTKWINERRKS